MRKLVVLSVAALALNAAPSFADGDIGCGIGTQIWKGQSGLLPKVLGATTNGSFGSQTFGITTGTLDCSQSGVITADARVNMYAGANIDKLARDMAVGGGESLDTLAHLMGVQGADKPAFFAFTKDNFAGIFSSDEMTAGDMLANMSQLMASDAQLAKYATL